MISNNICLVVKVVWIATIKISWFVVYNTRPVSSSRRWIRPLLSMVLGGSVILAPYSFAPMSSHMRDKCLTDSLWVVISIMQVWYSIKELKVILQNTGFSISINLKHGNYQRIMNVMYAKDIHIISSSIREAYLRPIQDLLKSKTKNFCKNSKKTSMQITANSTLWRHWSAEQS